MMQKIITALAAALLFFGAAYGQADYGKSIIGTWKFDLGGNFWATVEYKADGTFSQTMGGMTITGTYSVKGTTLKTDVKGQMTEFTIVSSDAKIMTLKRNKDGKTIVYTKQ